MIPNRMAPPARTAALSRRDGSASVRAISAGSIRTRERTASGRRAAASKASAPPQEWPIRLAPSPSRSAIQTASFSMSSGPRVGLSPKPGRSTRSTRKPSLPQTSCFAKVSGPPPRRPWTPPWIRITRGPSVPQYVMWIGSSSACASSMSGRGGHCAIKSARCLAIVAGSGGLAAGSAADCACAAKAPQSTTPIPADKAFTTSLAIHGPPVSILLLLAHAVPPGRPRQSSRTTPIRQVPG